jgi:hypothetical protein
MRQAIARAAAAKLSDGDRRTFEAVLALVASYSRLWDRVYVDQVARAAGLSERHARTCLARLGALEVIVWKPGRGRGVKSRLGLSPAITGTPDFPLSHADVDLTGELLDNEKAETAARENRNADADKTGSPGLPIPEKDRGESSEEKTPHADAEASACGASAALDDAEPVIVDHCPDCGEHRRLTVHIETGELVCAACVVNRYREAS